MTFVAILYALAASWLAVYVLNALFLTALFLRHRPASKRLAVIGDEELPHVTIQLPVYNEKYVATRLIDAICALDYPRDRLQVQVLDDSTDETVQIIAGAVRHWRRRGVRIRQLRRSDRREFKAGALQYGLQRATGEFIGIFDADFVPGRDWLQRAVSILLQPGSEDIGLLQSRWSHLNSDYSSLTRAQALAMDGHFGVEQVARCEGNLLLNFNGTAGLWRRVCIEKSGGWSGETLCEDLDLSYRAQMAGWKIRYDATLDVPAEVPAQLSAFKRQQFRWAKGSMQVARRLFGQLAGHSKLSPFQKLQGIVHLTGYMVHPLMVLVLLLTLPLLTGDWPDALGPYQSVLGGVSLIGMAAPLLYAVAQKSLYGEGWLQRYRWMPLLALLGSGVAVSNTVAVLQGLFGQPGGEFCRTPKFRLEGQSGSWQASDYALGVDWTIAGELTLSLYAVLCVIIAAAQDQWFAVPFLAIYAMAFGWVGLLSLWQAGAPAIIANRPRRLREVE